MIQRLDVRRSSVLAGVVLIAAALISMLALRTSPSSAPLSDQASKNRSDWSGDSDRVPDLSLGTPLRRAATEATTSAEDLSAATSDDSEEIELPAPTAGANESLVECPTGMRRDFSRARKLTSLAGIEFPPSMKMLPTEWEALKQRIDRLQEGYAEVDKERSPLLGSISDARIDNGSYEDYPNPALETDPSVRRKLMDTLARARRPASEGEIVIPGGRGGRVFIIRIQPTDDPRLFQIERILQDMKMTAGKELAAMFLHRL